MISIVKLIDALKLAQAGYKYADAVNQRKAEQRVLEQAYIGWKREAGIGFVAKNSEEWFEMMEATAAEYAAVRRAKRREQYRRDALLMLAGGNHD